MILNMIKEGKKVLANVVLINNQTVLSETFAQFAGLTSYSEYQRVSFICHYVPWENNIATTIFTFNSEGKCSAYDNGIME